MHAYREWTPVILRKTKQSAEKKQMEKLVSNFKPQYLSKLDDNVEIFKATKFDGAYVDQVTKKRLEKKWNQKQLASAINVDIAIIQRFEQGKELYDHNLKYKLNKVLDIKSNFTSPIT